MTGSHLRIAFAIAFASRGCESYGRTDGRTNEEVTTTPLNPSPPYRTRAYRRFPYRADERRFAPAITGARQ